MSRRNLRRSFRNDRMRDLYDRASEHEWSAERDGAGHIRMVSPDGGTVMVMSTTAVDTGRSVLNTEAVYKRWLRSQKEEPVNNKIEAAITEAQGRDAARQLLGVDLGRPLPPNEEDTVMTDQSKGTDQTDPTRSVTQGGIGGATGEIGLPPETAPSALNDGRFTIDEVEIVAKFAGTDGLVEISKLVEGLALINHMRTRQ